MERGTQHARTRVYSGRFVVTTVGEGGENDGVRVTERVCIDTTRCENRGKSGIGVRERRVKGERGGGLDGGRGFATLREGERAGGRERGRDHVELGGV